MKSLLVTIGIVAVSLSHAQTSNKTDFQPRLRGRKRVPGSLASRGRCQDSLSIWPWSDLESPRAWTLQSERTCCAAVQRAHRSPTVITLKQLISDVGESSGGAALDCMRLPSQMTVLKQTVDSRQQTAASSQPASPLAGNRLRTPCRAS